MNHADAQYLALLRKILEQGHQKSDRTGTGTYSLFGETMRFNLMEGFPLLTTKRLSFHNIKAELLWFLRGDTNVKWLQENKCHIWDEWANPITGDLGRVYGHQWRRWGAVDLATEGFWNFDERPRYVGGKDQIATAIHKIRNNPDDRRIIVSAWNVEDIEDKRMALPPCHAFFQFWTREGNLTERLRWANAYTPWAYEQALARWRETSSSPTLNEQRAICHPYFDSLGIPRRGLSCQMYQRSCDTFLGVPYNIASYALLTHMVGHVTNTAPMEFIWIGGDTHLYSNHIDQAYEQLERQGSDLPQLLLDLDIKEIDDFRMDHIAVTNYNPDPAIKAEISV